MRYGLLALALLLAASHARAYDPKSFVGSWDATYGRMVLAEKGDGVGGTYGGSNGISGTVDDTKFTFTYTEGGVTGEGWFTLSEDGLSFAGKWRPKGSQGWNDWTGKRVVGPDDKPEDPRPKVYTDYKQLPKDFPAWFRELDTDKDVQVSLAEWHAGSRPPDEFRAMDLNGDGFLEVKEYLRYAKAEAARAAKAKADELAKGDGKTPPGTGPMRPGGWGNDAKPTAPPGPVPADWPTDGKKSKGG